MEAPDLDADRGHDHEPHLDVHRHVRRGEANITWAEFGIDSGTTDAQTTAAVAPLLNHANSAQGGKSTGQVWTATAVLSFT